MKNFLSRVFVFWGLLFFIQPGHAQNLLTDGSFNTTTAITPIGAPPLPLNTWCSWNNEATVTSFTTNVSGGVCNYSFFNQGNNSWDVQLSQYGFPLVLGRHYRLSFDVKADADRKFGVYIGEESGLWTNLNAANYLQDATTGWTTRVTEFDATAVFNLHKLSFEMGAENIPMYFDNIILEETGAGKMFKIEIIGSAIPPDYWINGVDMPTTDGVTYKLLNYSLPSGEVKFRQDQNWAVNWGNYTFPSGTGYQDGPNIPVAPGTYDIIFNRLTGVYQFICVSGCVNSIGIIGSSVPPYNWQVDVKMNTIDGKIYTLNDYYLIYGELRFRQNDDWSVNWGGYTFPAGVGNMYAPSIQVLQGTYNITFNRETGEYYFESSQPSIGILGSALNGWDDDIDLQTTDGANYSLFNYPLTDGEVKFRQNNSWEINWGNTDFPGGVAYRNGPNIPVKAGNYNIYFNRLNGNYYFQLICPNPVLQCNGDIVVNADAASCGAVVWFDPPVVTNPCGNIFQYQIAGLPSGSFYNVGTTTNEFIVFNEGGVAFCSFNVTVKDVTPPVITQVSANPSSLWPANHKMKDVMIDYKTADNCGGATSSLSVRSNEPVSGTGDGDTAPDWVILDNHRLQLRAERSGKGSGRVYTVTITSTDASGNVATKTIDVLVPHNMGGVHAKGLYSANVPSVLKATVMPNPATQYFTLRIESAGDERVDVRLLDITGRLISNINAGKNNTVRFGDNLRPGIYIVEVIQGQQHQKIKVVKQ